MFWILYFTFTIAVTHVNSEYASPCLVKSQEPGLCMPLKSCKPVYNFFNRAIEGGGNISEQNKNILASLDCGTFRNIKHVCCPKIDIQLNVDGLNILKKYEQCGTFLANRKANRTANRIANGRKASLFEFPWMALLKYEDETAPFKCGGSLISDQYVLTAAHCVKGRETLLKEVRLGEYQISTDPDCKKITGKTQCAPPVEDIEIEQVILYEDYHRKHNDIALIKLGRKVEFKRHIKPICLPIYENLRSKVNKTYIVAGWGQTEKGVRSDILLKAYVRTVDRMSCENRLGASSLNYGHLCAGGKNLVDSCRGDSGGPLISKDISDVPRFIQFGVVSFGVTGCGAVNAPGVYANVSHYIQWITDRLEQPKYE